jgi:hypothetical protein
MERAGKPVMRLPMIPTPCHSCPKIPDGVDKVSDNAVEPTDRSWRAYDHYRKCRAVGVFPDDPIVRRNAAVVRAVEDDFEGAPLRRLLARLGG